MADDAVAAPSAPVKPDEAAFAREEAAALAEVKELNAKRERAQARIEALRKSSDELNARFSDIITKLQAMRAERKELEQERDALRADRDKRREAIATMTASSKELRSKVKVGGVDELERRLAALVTKQASESLSLREEKELIREIEALRSARSAFSSHTELLSKTDVAREEARNVEKELDARINGVYDALRERYARIQEQSAIADGLKKEKDEARAAFTAAIKERDEARNAGNDKFAALRELRNAFYASKQAYTAYVAEQARAKAAAAAAERAARVAAGGDASTAPAAAAGGGAADGVDEDTEQMMPWAAEIRLCDMLVAHLQRMKPVAAAASTAISAADAAAGAAACMAAVSTGGGPKLRLMKDAEDELAAYKPKGKGGKKGAAHESAAPASVAPAKAKPLVFDLSLLGSFKLLDITPPGTTADLDGVLAAVAAKKEHFLTAPPPPPKVEEASAEGGRGFSGRGGRGGRGGARGGRIAAGASRSVAVGAKVKTPYGGAVVHEVRADGMVVVDMTQFGARGYLQASQITSAA